MYGLFRFITRHIALILFLLLEVLSLSLAVRHNQGPREHYSSAKVGLSQFIHSRRARVFNYFSLREKVQTLQNINSELQEKLYNLQMASNISVDTLKKNDELDRYDVFVARVISNTADKQINHLVLDAGTEDGLQKGMGLVGAHGGVVGVITHCKPSYSRALSVLSPNINLSVSLTQAGCLGTLVWAPWDARYAQIENVPKHFDVQEGDTVITSGASFIFPQGIEVGKVEEVETGKGAFDLDIKVRLKEDITKVRWVSVIDFKNNPQFE